MHCTDHKTIQECYTAFDKFTIARKDNRVCTIPLIRLRSRTNCTFVYLKKLLIRLRRNNDEADWAAFKETFESHADLIIPIMNGRWLVSILDTYVDYASPIESRNALAALIFPSYEKFARTVGLCHNSSRNQFKGVHRQKFCSGLDTVQLTGGDMPTNFFTRVQRTLKTTPMIHTIFKRIMKLLVEEDATTMGQMRMLAADCQFSGPYRKLVLEE